jgi:hypothetical protein
MCACTGQRSRIEHVMRVRVLVLLASAFAVHFVPIVRCAAISFLHFTACQHENMERTS